MPHRTDIDERARAIGEKVADELFHNGSGEEADRLVLWDKNGRNLGGWCWGAVRDRVAGIVSGERNRAP